MAKEVSHTRNTDSFPHWETILIIVLCLLVGATIGGLSVFYWQQAVKEIEKNEAVVEVRNEAAAQNGSAHKTTISPVSEWKSYTSKQYKYAFKYPKEARIIETSAEDIGTTDYGKYGPQSCIQVRFNNAVLMVNALYKDVNAPLNPNCYPGGIGVADESNSDYIIESKTHSAGILQIKSQDNPTQHTGELQMLQLGDLIIMWGTAGSDMDTKSTNLYTDYLKTDQSVLKDIVQSFTQQ